MQRPDSHLRRSAVPSPSLSSSAMPHPHTAVEAILSASPGQPSVQSAVPSPSLSSSATPQTARAFFSFEQRSSGHSRRCNRRCRRHRCRSSDTCRSRNLQASVFVASLGQLSLQSAVPSPSVSVSGVPHAAITHAPSSIFAASLGQLSLQSAVPSPSVSVVCHTATADAFVQILSASSGQAVVRSLPCRRRRCRSSGDAAAADAGLQF